MVNLYIRLLSGSPATAIIIKFSLGSIVPLPCSSGVKGQNAHVKCTVCLVMKQKSRRILNDFVPPLASSAFKFDVLQMVHVTTGHSNALTALHMEIPTTPDKYAKATEYRQWGQ